uniref:Uncharacterized protein n=1 Tax=viral metagenome TaxID=1070528 RepID=A0A6C0IEI4_9ZZZZ
MNIIVFTFVLSSSLKFYNNVSYSKMNIVKNNYIDYITEIINNANELYSNRYVYGDINTRFFIDNINAYTEDEEDEYKEL